MRVIILSGGSGKRLWPLSNEVRSKQFLKIFRRTDGSHESMVQRTYRMIRSVDPTASVTIATSENQVVSIKSQLGDEVSISVEPCRRDTFPAIALASAYLHDKQGVDKDEAVVVCPVDPYVDEGFFDKLKLLHEMAEKNVSNLVLMGIKPTYPSQKYGYIIPEATDDVSGVRSFKEKPDMHNAVSYIEQGALWNSGVFAFKLSYILEKSAKILGYRDYEELVTNYDALDSISFDYAVAEHESSISVLRYEGEWRDLGTWNTFTEAMSEVASGNVVYAECENTHIVNELQIPLVTLGLKNVVVAATHDGVLVSDKNMSSFLKEYVPDIGPMTGKQSWGEYEVLDYRSDEMGNIYSITKHLYISSGKCIDRQSTDDGTKTWTVVEGEGRVVLDEERINIQRGSMVVVPSQTYHELKATTDMHIIEVQVSDE